MPEAGAGQGAAGWVTVCVGRGAGGELGTAQPGKKARVKRHFLSCCVHTQ